MELVESCRMAWGCLRALIPPEDGQDLVEYTLLLGFMSLASAALFTHFGGSISGIWSATNSRVSVANMCAAS